MRICDSVAISPDQRVLAALSRLLGHTALIVPHSHNERSYAEQEHKGANGRRSRQVDLKLLLLKDLDDAKIAEPGGIASRRRHSGWVGAGELADGGQIKV